MAGFVLLALFNLRDHHLGQVLQYQGFGVAELMRPFVDDAQAADGMPVAGDQGCASIEANAVRGRHQLIVHEPGVGAGVDDLHHAILLDGMGTKRLVDRGLARAKPHSAGKPLTILVNQRDQHRGDVEISGGETTDSVKVLCGGGLKPLNGANRGETLFFGL